MNYESCWRCPFCLGSGYRELPVTADWIERSNPWRVPDCPNCQGKGFVQSDCITWNSYGVYQLKKEDE
jgi:hypothetical protein